MRERAGGRNTEAPDTAPLDEKLASSDDSISEAILLTRPNKRRAGDTETLGDYATASERALLASPLRNVPEPPPSGPAERVRTLRPRARRCGVPSQAFWVFPLARGPTPHVSLPGKVRNPSELDGGAEGQSAQRPSRTTQAPHPCRPGPATSGAPALRRKPRNHSGGGERKIAERKEVPTGTFSREGRRVSGGWGVCLGRLGKAV